MKKIAFLLPAYNVEDQIADVIEEISRSFSSCRIVVVNDGSSDDTESIIRSFPSVVCLNHDKNEGKGVALSTGIQYLRTVDGIKGICFLDADGQHAPVHLPDFVQAFDAGKGSFLLGARDFRLGKMPVARILSNKITSALVSLRIGKRICDSQCGFRLIDMRLLKRLPVLKSKKYDFETELLIAAAGKGASFHHIPIQTIYEKQESHINHVKDTFRFVRTLLTT